MAKKFNFNLQKYLDYKESIVNNKSAELLKSKKNLDDENKKLDKLFSEKELANKNFKENKPSRILDFAVMSSYSNQISNNIDDQKIILSEKMKKFENEKISLQKDFKEKKALEIIKDKKLDKHKSFIKKINNKNLDDLYMTRAKRDSK